MRDAILSGRFALCAALSRYTETSHSPESLMSLAANLEVQVIGVPTGVQDYRPAMYGGVAAIEMGPAGVTRTKLNVDPRELARRIIIAYTGQTRNSGINNWEITKKALDGDKGVIRNLKTISNCALKMYKLLKKGRITGIAPVFDREWQARKQLAPTISTPQMEKLIRSAIKNGAHAAKVCGAGGGGCLAFIVPPEKKQSWKMQF